MTSEGPGSPTSVPGYRIERVLGRGGMGTVYLAANLNLPRYEALKVLNAEGAQDQSFRARFVREATMAASLDHPNIVTVYNRGETASGDPWIAMQYIEGSDALSATVTDPMPLDRATYVISEVAEALDYVHSRGLVHRDVKPANVLLARSGRVMLADFGIARALDDLNSITAMGNVVMTVAYAAPELLTGGHVDGRTDIYALGCTLFRMLTGKTPYESFGTMPAMANAHMSAPPPRASELLALPQSVDFVIAKALAKRPEDRFQSAGEFAQALQQILNEPATQLRAQPLVDSQSTQIRSAPIEPSIHATQLRQPTPTQHGAAPMATPPARTRQALLLMGAIGLVLVSAIIAVLVWPRDRVGSNAPETSTPTPAYSSLADLPFTTLNRFLPNPAELPTGYEVLSLVGGRDLDDEELPDSRNTRVDKTPANCNTADPAWTSVMHGHLPPYMEITNPANPDLKFQARLGPLYTDPGNPPDVLVKCDRTTSGFYKNKNDPGMDCTLRFTGTPPKTATADVAISDERCHTTDYVAGERPRKSYFAAFRGLLVYVTLVRDPKVSEFYDLDALNKVFTAILQKIADYKNP